MIGKRTILKMMGDRFYVIYDGYCNLCVSLVKFLEQLDQGKTFQYLPMQAEDPLRHLGIQPEDCQQGMILLEISDPHRRWQGSDAAEEIGRRFPLGFLFVDAYRHLPGLKGTGDRLYEQVRDNRYAWFGKRDRLYESTYPVCETGHCPGSWEEFEN